MIEKEHKVLLTKEQYDKISCLIDWDAEFFQINHYYNDKDCNIFNDDITVRIREKNSKYSLQTKILRKREKSLFVKEEKTVKIMSVMEKIPSALLESLVGKKYFEIKRVGSLITFRKICNKYNGITICLDYNEYLSKSDYELEIEYSTATNIKEIIAKFEKEVGLQFSEHICGKNNRFFKEYFK